MKKKISILLVLILLGGSLSVYAATGTDKKVLNKEEVVQLALNNNSEVIKLQKKLEIAEAQLEQAEAAFYPKINLGADYTRWSDKKSNPILSKNTYSTSLSINQPIFKGGSIWVSYEQVKKNLEKAKLMLQQTKQEVTYQVLDQYYSVLQAEKMVEVYQQQLKESKVYLEEAKVNKEVGIGTKTDVLQARVNYTQAQQDLLEGKNNLEIAKLALKNTLELDDSILLELESELSWQEKKVDVEEAYNYALEHNPQFKLIDLKEENTKLELKKANWSDKYPELSISGGYSTQSDKLKVEDGEWKIGFNVTYNLFDGGLDNAKIKELTKKLENVNLDQQDVKDNVKLQVKRTVLNLKAAEDKIKLAKLNLKQTKESLEHSELRFEEGIIDILDLLKVQTTLQQVKTNYYQAIYDYNVEVARLNKLIGKSNL